MLKSSWLVIRNLVDSYYERKALKPGHPVVTRRGGVRQDIEDIYASDSYKQASRASYFVLHPDHRPMISRADEEIMREALKNQPREIWLQILKSERDGRCFMFLPPALLTSKRWSTGDRLEFRELVSGDVLLSTDRRAKR